MTETGIVKRVEGTEITDALHPPFLLDPLGRPFQDLVHDHLLNHHLALLLTRNGLLLLFLTIVELLHMPIVLLCGVAKSEMVVPGIVGKIPMLNSHFVLVGRRKEIQGEAGNEKSEKTGVRISICVSTTEGEVNRSQSPPMMLLILMQQLWPP